MVSRTVPPIHDTSVETFDEQLCREVCRLTEVGRLHFAKACARGYLVTQQGDADGPLSSVWSAWCAATRRASVTVHRYRGVDQPARSSNRWHFLALAGVELSLAPAGCRLMPAGIVAVGRALAEAGIGPDQPWSLAPQRVSVGRVPAGVDERLAQALVSVVTRGECVDGSEPTA